MSTTLIELKGVRLPEGGFMLAKYLSAFLRWLRFTNAAEVNNPTYEFVPPKNINGESTHKSNIGSTDGFAGFNGLQIPSQFLVDTLNGNQFPNLHLLPDGNIFVSANQQAMILNWKTNTETRLPNIPNGVRISSPFSASATLLPLTPENNFTPEILICGGSTISDQVTPANLSSQTPASNQCIRMVLNEAGIEAGWQVEEMPQSRTMTDLILLPDKRVLIVNGAQTGVAGYVFVRPRLLNHNCFQLMNVY
jgi:hypothetical protein